MSSDRTADGGGYTFAEELWSSLIHGVGAALSIAGTVLLLVPAVSSGDPWKVVSFSVFGATLTLLYLSSMLYHGLSNVAVKGFFKMLDHCSIYLLIAGTYTPFLLVNMRGQTGWLLFAIIWGLAGAGIGLKLAYGHRFKALRVGVYLAMGWLVVAAGAELVASLNSRALYLLVAGGLIYTSGVAFYLAYRIPYNHVVWHLFVVGGSGCHFAAIYYGVLPYQ